MDLSKVAACSHSHILHPFCSEQSSSEKIRKVFLFALGAVVLWFYFRPTARSYTPRPSESPTDKPLDKFSAFILSQSLSPPLQPVRESSSYTLSNPFLKSGDEIDQLPQKLGVSLDIIQSRAQRKMYSLDGKNVTNSGETDRGFIENDESLLSLIKADWKKAEKAKITHAEMADHLHNIVETAKKAGGNPNKSIGLDYEVLWENKPILLRLQVMFVKNPSPDTDIFRSAQADITVGASQEEVIIQNVSRQILVKWTPVRERYLRDFGFYSNGIKFDTVKSLLQTAPSEKYREALSTD